MKNIPWKIKYADFWPKNYLIFLPLTLKVNNPYHHRGHLVIKSTSFKVLPVSLSEVFQLECNLKFSSVQAFSKVKDILSVCLASLTPLSVPQIYAAVNALQVNYYAYFVVIWTKICWQQFFCIWYLFVFSQFDWNYDRNSSKILRKCYCHMLL